MSFLSKRTPLYKSKREESPTRALHTSVNWENFKCEIHPQLQIQALHHNKRNNTFSLVCVKCIIEGDYFTDGEDESITVKDLLDTVEEKIRARRSGTYDSPENIQEKFVNFLLKDYIGTYEKYLESQASQIDTAIEETIEKLGKVRDKYRQYYSKQLSFVRDQGSDIKDEINKLLENEGGQTSTGLTSMNEIYKRIDKVENQEELLELFSDLYKKSKEQGGSDMKVTDGSHRLLERMESFREKALSVKGREIDVSRFESMQETLQNLLKTDSQAFKNSVERSERAEREERRERVEREKSDKKERSTKAMKVEYEASRSRMLESPPRSRLLASRSNSDAYSPARSASSESEEETYVKAPKRRQPDAVRRPRKTANGHEIGSHSLKKLKAELEKYEDHEDPLSPDSKKEKIMTSLNDWINRRITGYLVFQNTMNSDPDQEKDGGISETGVHLNQAMGKRWKSLSEEEREEYKALAKDYRKDFKQDLEENEDFDDTDALIETLDDRIKKLKRE